MVLPYLDIFKLFMNKKINSQLDVQLNALSKLPQQQILDHYRLAFLSLSGLEVNQAVYDKIERFSLFIKEQTKLMQQVRGQTEHSLVVQFAMS